MFSMSTRVLPIARLLDYQYWTILLAPVDTYMKEHGDRPSA